jgi:hypothetical protein
MGFCQGIAGEHDGTNRGRGEKLHLCVRAVGPETERLSSVKVTPCHLPGIRGHHSKHLALHHLRTTVLDGKRNDK